MSEIREIAGTVTLADGETVEFSVTANQGWMQWGNATRVLGRTVFVMDALEDTVEAHNTVEYADR